MTTEELNELIRKGESGDDNAMLELAKYYWFAKEISKEEVSRWLKEVSEKGLDAMLKMSKEYFDNIEKTETVFWLEKAADLGNTDAIINLGLMYRKGYGVKQDNEKFNELLEKLSEKGAIK